MAVAGQPTFAQPYISPQVVSDGNGFQSSMITGVPTTGGQIVSIKEKPAEQATYTNSWEWSIIILIIILSLAFIIWFVWYLGFRTTGEPVGSPCTTNSTCEIGTYCSSNDTCEKGQGRGASQKCDGNRDCMVGLECNRNSGTCQVTNS